MMEGIDRRQSQSQWLWNEDSPKVAIYSFFGLDMYMYIQRLKTIINGVYLKAHLHRNQCALEFH